jgi:hypothetical protein
MTLPADPEVVAAMQSPTVLATLRNPSAWADCLTDTRIETSPGEVMSPVELEAMKRAGRDAGGYLSNIGKTDMGSLSREEWDKFCSVMLIGFELHLAGINQGNAG